MASVVISEIIYPKSRKEWRDWLSKNFDSAKEIWLAIPKKDKPFDYNDIVEEALCFQWIDSVKKSINDDYTVQRFSPRKKGSNFSQLNIERLKLLIAQQQIHPSCEDTSKQFANEPFIFPKDIIDAIKRDKQAWKYFQQFSDAYKRLRISSIELSRGDDALFEKRLTAFVEACQQNKLIVSVSGIDKYY
jgi:uncharacterized protein YdeI (YjbR/CyaY-like superfamily)